MNTKAGMQYVRSEVSNDLRILYNTGYFTQNLRALPIKIDNIKIEIKTNNWHCISCIFNFYNCYIFIVYKNSFFN